RALAAGAATWQRILTDPITGAHLPVSAETYHPTAQMRLQLRLRHPVCAVPGCTRTTVLAAEDDHIIEYDHDHPGRGGRTSLWNLHRPCWHHHTQKTAGLIDPGRDPADDPATGDHTTPAGPLETPWTTGATIRPRTRAHTDLLTPHTTRALDHAWRTHQHTPGDGAGLPPRTPPRPRRGRPTLLARAGARCRPHAIEVRCGCDLRRRATSHRCHGRAVRVYDVRRRDPGIERPVPGAVVRLRTMCWSRVQASET